MSALQHSQPAATTHLTTPQKPKLHQQEPTQIPHDHDHDHDLESGLAPLSQVSSVSSVASSPTHPAYNLASSPITAQTTRNVSSSHLLSSSNEKLPGLTISPTQPDAAAWPTRQDLLQEKRAISKQKCNGLVGRVKRVNLGLSRKQKMWMKILVGLLVVGLAIGLGVGISRAVGGGVWGKKGETEPVGGAHS